MLRFQLQLGADATSAADTLDALPPSLTRSLSDLKELDAVLSAGQKELTVVSLHAGSLQTITEKLKYLFVMMNTPPPGSTEDPDAPSFTPLQRLQLLREVTEEARVFRLGGEDKIRVATGTCETIATHTSHLSTLSSLLLSFLPAHLLPQLPPPSAPHGYPSSSTPASALARRQNFDYPPSNYPGAGSTARMNAAMGMVREHWELTRGGGMPPRVPKRKPQHTSLHQMGTDSDFGLGGGGGRGLVSGDCVVDQKGILELTFHQNYLQYAKKKQTHHSNGASAIPMGQSGSSTGAAYHSNGHSHSHANGNGHSNGHGSAPNGRIMDHPMGTTAVDAVKAKRGVDASPLMTSGTASRAQGGNGGGSVLYPGMASQDEYNAATAGSSRTQQKRKVEDAAAASKRRKKGPDSPDLMARVIPAPSAQGMKPPRRAATKAEEAAAAPAYDDEDTMDAGDPEDEGDGTVYCVCHQVSFGEMIGCDGSDCDREWFHLSCVGLSAIPKGRWFCDDCRRQNEKAPKKRR
ncbi:hypothetical protein P7C70_g8046, partial [Phenoliferia sp. Uapishka_3]